MLNDLKQSFKQRISKLKGSLMEKNERTYSSRNETANGMQYLVSAAKIKKPKLKSVNSDKAHENIIKEEIIEKR